MPAALANRSDAAAFLCYHSVHEAAARDLGISPDLFEAHLAALRRWGYVAGTEAGLDELACGRRPDRPRVFLTIDDGFRDARTRAFPLLREYGFTAMVFVLPRLVDEGAAFPWPEVADDVRRQPALFRSITWPDVEAMAEGGIEFGSHTCSHPRLDTLGDEELAQELLDSRMRIKERLGRCNVVAYPYGAWDERVSIAARRAGYRYGLSLPYGSAYVGWQRGWTPLSIPRLPIDRRDDLRRFRLKLTAPGRRLYLSPVKAVVRRAAATRAAPRRRCRTRTA
jgi:peptidoglycan/xylan/chitin deacetylase (PgdA/CDA1 family)